MDLLYIDDDADEIALFIEALRNADRSIKFSYALSINDALRKLNNYLSTPDAIFVDYHFSGMDGYECVKQIKERNELKPVPVVVVSAILTPGMIDELNKLGVYHFLSKDALHSDMGPALKVLLDSFSKAEKNPT